MSQVFSLESQKCISSKKTPIFELVFTENVLHLKSLPCNSIKWFLPTPLRFRNISEHCLILHPKAAITVTWRSEL